MKTAMIARFVLGAGAIFAVAGLAGCGAETGQGAAEGVGQTSEALISSPPSVTANPGTNLPVLASGMERYAAAGCIIRDDVAPNHEFLVVGGGVSSAPAVRSDIIALDLTSMGTWSTLTPALATARKDLQAIKVPDGVGNKCAFIGGDDGTGAAIPEHAAAPITHNYDVLTVHNGAFSIAQLGGLTARTKFSVSTCGSNIVAFGGESSGTPIALGSSNTIQKSTGAAAFANVGDLNFAQSDFAFAKDPSTDGQYVLATGNDGATVKSNQVQLVKLSTCSSVANAVTGTNLATGLQGARLLPLATNRFLVVAGYTAGGSPTLRTSTDDIVPSWTGTPSYTLTANTTAGQLAAGVRYPMLVADSAAAPTFALIGGDNGAGTATTLTNTAQALPSTYAVTAGAWKAANLNIGRVAGVALYFATTGKTYVVTGRSINGSPNFIANMEEIN